MLASMKPKGLCMVGKMETENVGIEKVIINTISNLAIHFLIAAGLESKGHNSGNTLISLWKYGIDENRRVINSTGKRPMLTNVTREEVEVFRKQVEVIDMVGCEDIDKIAAKIQELVGKFSPLCNCQDCDKKYESIKPGKIANVEVIQAKEPESENIKLDKAGYFVIIPQSNKKVITVEHYSYNNQLLRIIEGTDTRSIYYTIINNNWVTELSHAAYLGRELTKAELSMKYGFKYVQDGA